MHISSALQWCHNRREGVSNYQPHDCLLNRLFGRRSKKTLKLCVTSLCARNSPVTGEFHTQMASNAENFSIWWRHHEKLQLNCYWITNIWLENRWVYIKCIGSGIHFTKELQVHNRICVKIFLLWFDSNDLIRSQVCICHDSPPNLTITFRVITTYDFRKLGLWDHRKSPCAIYFVILSACGMLHVYLEWGY